MYLSSSQFLLLAPSFPHLSGTYGKRDTHRCSDWLVMWDERSDRYPNKTLILSQSPNETFKD